MAKRQTRRSRRGTSAKARGQSSGMMDKLRQLDEQRRALLEGARQEALKAVEVALAALNNLGFNYSLTQRKSVRRATRSSTSGKGTRSPKAAACPICGFQTDPPHDRRAHRSQSEKKPFTTAELDAKGLRKIT